MTKKRRSRSQIAAHLEPAPAWLDPAHVHRDPFGNIWIAAPPGVSSGDQWLHVDGASERWINLGRSLLYVHAIFDADGRPIGLLDCPDPERCPHATVTPSTLPLATP
jgi:hypothetical protein